MLENTCPSADLNWFHLHLLANCRLYVCPFGLGSVYLGVDLMAGYYSDLLVAK